MTIKNKASNIHRCCLWGVIALLLSSCDASDDSELSRYIYRIKTRPAKKVEPIPEFATPKKFAYPEVDKRRNPFRPVVEPRKADTLAPNTTRPKQALEAFPLDALQFVGVIKEKGAVWGLISQPGGLVSRIKQGDYMGKNYGQVVKISDEEIQLIETIQINGKWEKKPMVIKLYSKEAK